MDCAPGHEFTKRWKLISSLNNVGILYETNYTGKPAMLNQDVKTSLAAQALQDAFHTLGSSKPHISLSNLQSKPHFRA